MTTNTRTIKTSECSNWIRPEEGKAEYIRVGWATWAFYNRQAADGLLALWREKGFLVAA